MLVSGVAAVSAYEAHIVDVKAHVENALGVPVEMDFGIVFPQELVENDFKFGLSNSFLDEDQDRVSDLLYGMMWEMKPIEDGYVDADNDTYFEPLAPYLTLSDADPTDGNDWVTTPPAGWPGTTWTQIAGGELNKTATAGDRCDEWHIRFAVPVFDKWYNATTDPKTPSGILVYDNQDYVIVTENVCGQDVLVPHADMGSNLKIQVLEYSYD